jgi:hypothetical protein
MRRLHSRIEKLKIKKIQWDSTKASVKYLPRAKRPVIPIHGVGEFARFRTRQRIAQVAIGVERKTADKRSQFERNPI